MPSIINRSQVFVTHWWGHGWRPWWRKYDGINAKY